MSTPALMIAAPHGRSGKTTVSIGLCAALRKRGIKVTPFKKGPDYIDPSWLTAAAENACHNLDPFMFDEATLLKAFQRPCAAADIAVIEANMGLYDSYEEDGRGSSAWLARLLGVPVILVVNASRMTRSVAALVNGYKDFEPGTVIAGVILNNVNGLRHRDKLVKAVEKYCGIPVLGCIPSDKGLALKERHLGIVPFNELKDSDRLIENACEIVESNVDLDRICAIAKSVTPNIVDRSTATKQYNSRSVKIGVLHDKAFSFYYPDNLEALQDAGAEIIYINSFTDSLPDIDGLYIGGGFPELYLDKLEANARLRQGIATAARHGLPVYAECAGLMYLCRSILKDGRLYRMAGVFEADVELRTKPVGHGYVEVEVQENNPFYRPGTILKGHEFHYSELVNYNKLNFTFKIKRGQGIDSRSDGVVLKNTLATYFHIHALAVPDWPHDFVKLALSHKIKSVKIAA